MKKIFTLIVFILLVSILQMAAQPAYDMRFTNAKADATKTKYYVTVEIKVPTAGQTFKMGNGNLTFNFNTLNLSNPIVNTRFNFSGGAYALQTVTQPVAGMVSINIVYYDAGFGDAAATAVTSSWLKVTTVEFTLIDPSGCADFVYRRATDAIAPFLANDAWDVAVPRNSVIDEPACPLPVELTSFTAKPLGRSAQLDWTTASEINNYGFEVQRYNDETQEWDYVDFVYSKASGGNSQKILQYDLLDKDVYDPVFGNKTFYYRLKQVDINSSFEFSEIRSVSFNSGNAMDDILLKIYPNPVSDVLYLEILNYQNLSTYDLLIHDKYGKLLYSDRFRKRTDVDVSKMPQGSYSVTVRNDQNIKTLTFTIAR